MFYILRHGRTDWNEEHRLQGEVDIPLNEPAGRWLTMPQKNIRI